MKVCMLLVLAAASQVRVTPVQKVIQLLQDMTEKGKKEKHEEQVQFAAYKQFCDDTTTEKQRAIKEANAQIEQLTASIQKAQADAATLSKEIAKLDEDISVAEGNKKAATEVRERENADYLTTHKDYSESVDALERAVVMLKKQAHDVSQAALVQVSQSALIPEHAKKVISAFLAQGDELGQDPMSVSAPQANAYEFQSQGVVDMLEKLGDKFEDERTDLEKTESEARHAYQMLMQDLTAEIETKTDDREAKASQKASKLQKAAEDKGDLADTTATRDSDQEYLDNLVATCSQKSSDFENRQQLRTEELEAIAKAVEILSSGAVSGAADKHLPALVQKSTSFIQIKSVVQNPAQKRVAEFLRQKGSAINSRVLSALAVRVAEDPFTKVKKMIKDLIVRLMEEANEEAEHKGWCDTELSTNEQTRKEKTSAVETLHAEIDELTASIAKLSQDITDLSAEIADIDRAVAEATEIRSKEKAENEQTIKDSQEAQTAVAQATTVLKEFYEKAGEATSFVQQQPESPEIFDAPYQGMGGESGGVVGMLEVIQSDFARLETDTKAAEAQAQSEFDKFSSESAVNRAEKAKDVEHKTTKKTNQESALTSKKADLEGTQKELDAALAYYDKLKPSCVDAGVSYDDRVSRRKEEIESLQEALRILNGEDIAFLQK
jgi:septal ring factor EnvC (AmiA/AmiB activator)